VTRRPGRDRFLNEEMLRHLAVIAVGANCGRDGLVTDDRTRYAVEHAAELLAEAAKKTSAAFKAGNPKVPWSDLGGLRRDVAHPYDIGRDPIEVERLWRFVRDDAPVIAQRLKKAKFPE
jgi:uncharacterized protein with HEPN domain